MTSDETSDQISDQFSGQRITTLVFDYGGVLTNPLEETFYLFCKAVGISPLQLREAMVSSAREHRAEPMAELEVAAITEDDMIKRLAAYLPEGTLDRLEGKPFGEWWFKGRRTETAVVAAIAGFRERGYTTALLTNNVREWEPRWRAQVDTDALFDEVVDSSRERVRKPAPEIYRRLLERLGKPASECLMVDDLEENCAAARDLGFSAVLWTSADASLPEIEAVLAAGAAPAPVAEGAS